MRNARLGIIAGAATCLALTGLALGASSASAANMDPGNCPPGTFCVWDGWGYPAPTVEPTLVTEDDWSGSVPARHFFNGTSDTVELTFVQTLSDGTQRTYEHFVAPGTGSYLTSRLTVTEVDRIEAER